MDNRYRYNRPRSPTLYNPARASLPVNLAYPEHQSHHHHLHVVPTTRREVIPISVSQPRSSAERVNTHGTHTPAPVTTTTYKIKAEPSSRGSSVREGSRSRRATLDSQNIPTVITTIAPPPRQHPHRPVVHGSSNGRSSPVGNPYRSSAEDQYYAVPASSGKHRSQHAHRYSTTMDDADMSRLARESGRLQVERGREAPVYNSRPRSVYSTTNIPRQLDTVGTDYGDEGFGYTNPKDLVQYDLNNNPNPRRQRSDSRDGRASRPASINGYEQVARSYEPRERGPPPSTRGFAQVNARAWPQHEAQVRLPVPPPPPMDPIQRPHSARPVESVQRPSRVDPPYDGALLGEPTLQRRRSTSRRPVSVYQDRDRRQERDDGREYYDPRDDDLRRERKYRKEPNRDEVEPRGFGVRPERVERDERGSDYARSDRPDRVERPERNERPERRSEHSSGRDALTAGLSTAAAALGIGALAKKGTKDDKKDDKDDANDRDEPRRREDREDRDEPRRRRERDESERPKERRREEREEPPKERRREEREADERPKERRREDREDLPALLERKPREEFLDLSGGRDEELERVGRRRPESVVNGAASIPRSDSPPSDEQRSRRPRRQSAAAFNPRDAMDLKALKQELASKGNSPPVPPKEPLEPVPVSLVQPREPVVERSELRDDRGRLGPLAPNANSGERQQLRVVSPPREPPTDKPVKGILRQPREKFPEDPSPIREGVAPLKDAKKDGVPPDARWTKINRKLVNPEALEAGKERYEAREDFVIVLRVLNKEEVQAYAVATQQIREAREDAAEREASDKRRKARRERHERHKRDRESGTRGESTHRSRRRRHHQDSHSDSQSDETTDEEERPKMLEQAPRHVPSMSGGLGDPYAKDNPSLATGSSRRRDD